MVEADETKRDGSRAVIEVVEADELKRGGSCAINTRAKCTREGTPERPWRDPVVGMVANVYRSMGLLAGRR